MRKFFGQKSKPQRPPTPVPTDQFPRQQQRAPSNERWVVVQDTPAGLQQERTRSNSLTSLPPNPPPKLANNTSVHEQLEGIGSLDRPSNDLSQASQNHTLKKPPSRPHGTTTLLRSLDPEQNNPLGSASPSLESLPSTFETERDPRSAEREYEIERERVRQREKDRERERRKDKDRQWVRVRDRDQDQDREKDRDKPKGKEKMKGLFTSNRDKEKDREREMELTRMIGFVTATASEDWSLVLDVCERASSSEAAAREASRALRHEFKYAEPGAQLSAARLWAIMLQNCSEVFIAQVSSKKFIETLEEVLHSGATSPVVRERLLDVLAAAAFSHPGNGKEGYRALWRKVKPQNKPDEGIPFDEDDAMLNPSPQSDKRRQRPPSEPYIQHRVISMNEDMRRLLEECEIGKGNAQLLNQALTFARPEELGGPLISEWYRKCRSSQEFIMAQIPWATAQADRSREVLSANENGLETRPIPTTKEEELLAALLGANQELLEVFRIYDDLERLGVAEREEREVQERSRKEVKLDRTQIQLFSPDGSFQMEGNGGMGRAGGSAEPSRSSSPALISLTTNTTSTPGNRHALPLPLSHSISYQANSQGFLPHSALALPPPAPLGPRQARPTRTPSPDRPPPPASVPHHGHSGSLGIDIKRLALMSVESPQELTDRASVYGSEQAQIAPSAKAMGKRKLVVEGNGDLDEPSNSDDVADGTSIFLGDDGIDDGDADHDGSFHYRKKPVKYVYDAAAERAKAMRRDLGIPAPLTNGKAR